MASVKQNKKKPVIEVRARSSDSSDSDQDMKHSSDEEEEIKRPNLRGRSVKPPVINKKIAPAKKVLAKKVAAKRVPLAKNKRNI